MKTNSTEKKFSLNLTFQSGFVSKVETFASDVKDAIEKTQERYNKYPEAFVYKSKDGFKISKVKEIK